MAASSQSKAAATLLDIVHDKLVRGDSTIFSELVYALVDSDQQDCADMLDEQLATKYLQDRGPEYG